MLPRIALTALAASALVPSAATASPFDFAAGFRIEISGEVPVICRAEVENSIVAPQEGVVSLGTMREFCNGSNGYEIYADHSPELADAVLVVDGVEMKLSAGGATRISRSDHAAIASRSLELRLPDGRSAPVGSLSFRIVAL